MTACGSPPEQLPTMKSQKTGSESSSANADAASEEAEPAVNVNDPKMPLFDTKAPDYDHLNIEPLFEDLVYFETFSKSDFRAVKVLECEAVPKSKKLLKFVLDDGTDEKRVILSGIHAFYEPEQLIGKTLIAITNLPSRAMMGMEPEPPMPGEPVMLVATTQEVFMGAAVIQYPGFMEQAAEQIGGDFFVLPSSIHEVLLIPDDGKADFHELAAMVQSINETQVAPADRLSDNVYHYDKTDRVFELADKTADRKREQKLAKKAEQKGSVEKKSSVLAQLGEKKKEAMEHAPKAKAPGRAVPEAAL